MLKAATRPITGPHILTRGEAGVLLSAPLVAIAARLLATPVFQDDNDKPDNVRYLAEVADHAVRNDVAGALTIVSAILYAAAALAVGSIAVRHFRRTGGVGAALAFAGAFGLAGWGALVAISAQAARADDREAMVALLDAAYDAPGSNVYYGVILIGALGWVVLGYCLYRSRLVPRASAVLTALGGAGVMATAPGPLTSFIVGAAVVSLAGLGWIVLNRTAAGEGTS